MSLPRNFRKLTIQERKKAMESELDFSPQEKRFFHLLDEEDDLADVMVENALGFTPIPLGLLQGLMVNGKEYMVPLATEEPSVIAALNYGAKILFPWGGLQAQGPEAWTKGQIFLQVSQFQGVERVRQGTKALAKHLYPEIQPMEQRGGGLGEWDILYHQEIEVLEVGFWVNTVDSMGANLVNTLGEKLVQPLEKLTGGQKIMAILSNSGEKRLATARFSIPWASLKKTGQDPGPLAQRICAASQIAQVCSQRAITHNKGIMNGVSALALATGNDTRALEAAVHSYASHGGQYKGLSTYHLEGDQLVGEITIPMPLASVGGGVGFHPASSLAMKTLGSPSAKELGALGAAVGLVQNFAALLALTSSGIQKGHMSLHAGRLAYMVGARGKEIPSLVREIVEKGVFRIEESRLLWKNHKDRLEKND